MMPQSFEDPFAYTFGYHPLFDVARIFLIFVAVAILGRVVVLLATGEYKTWITSQRAGVAVFVGLAVQTIIQQVEALGTDLLWWRLPLLMFIGINACIVLYAGQATRGTSVNRTTSLYLVARAAIEDALCDRDQLAGKPCLHDDHGRGK